jgi:hypothetical protein
MEEPADRIRALYNDGEATQPTVGDLLEAEVERIAAAMAAKVGRYEPLAKDLAYVVFENLMNRTPKGREYTASASVFVDTAKKRIVTRYKAFDMLRIAIARVGYSLEYDDGEYDKLIAHYTTGKTSAD